MVEEDLKPGSKIVLGDIPLAQILAKIHLAKETFVLSIKKGEIIKNIFIKDGEAVFANSNSASDGIKNLLIKEKKLSESQISAINEHIQKNKTKFLEAAVTLGYFPPDKVEGLKSKQAKQIIIECHEMIDGILEFIKNDSIFSKINSYKIDMHNLVFEGIKKYMTKEMIEKSLLDLSPENYFLILPRGENDSLLSNITPEERGLITIIMSSPKISDVFSSSFLKKEDVYKYLYCLKIFKFVEIETPLVRESRLLEKNLTPENKKIKSGLLETLDDYQKRNYYEILEVLSDAPQTELDEAFSKLRKKYDPLKYKKLFGPAEKDIPDRLLLQISQAYEVLSDTNKRREYDSFVARGEAHKFREMSAILGKDEYFKLAKESLQKNDFQQAIKHLEKALEYTPKDPETLCELASAIHKASKGKDTDLLNKALSTLKKAHEADPKYCRTFVEFGTIFKSLGKTTQANESFKKAILLNPNCKDAENELKMTDPQAVDRLKIRGLYNCLEKFNYYQILDIESNISSDAIKDAYHEATKQYHPDKHFTKDNEELSEMTKAIYKRIVEAYMVLKNTDKRKEYNAQLGEYKEEKEIRLKDAAEVVQKKEKTEIVFKFPQAKKFFELGLTSLNLKRLNSAKINFQLALKAEPDNIHIKRKLKEVLEMEKGEGDKI